MGDQEMTAPNQDTAAAGRIIASLSAKLNAAEINELIAASVPAAIARLNAPDAGVIIYANAAADNLFGYIQGEMIGMHVRDLIPERLRAGHDAHFAQFSRDPSPRPMGTGHMKIVGLRRDGVEISLAIALLPRVVAGDRCAIATIIPLPAFTGKP